MHEAGILKLEKTNIQAWKDKGVLPEEIGDAQVVDLLLSA
jgi:hypothetical protein